MEIVVEHIGTLPTSHVGGLDSYYKLKRTDGDLTVEQARDWFLPQVYIEGSGPGTRFCHSVLVQQVQYNPDTVICIAQQRLDV